MDQFCPPLPDESIKLLRAEKKQVAAILAQYNARPNLDRTPFADTSDTHYLSDYVGIYVGLSNDDIRVAPTIQKKFPNLFGRDTDRQYFLNRLGLQALAALNAYYGIQKGIVFYSDWLHPTIFAHRVQNDRLSRDYLQVLEVAQERFLRQMPVQIAARRKPRPPV
jgi:hypothetical protein